MLLYLRFRRVLFGQREKTTWDDIVKHTVKHFLIIRDKKMTSKDTALQVHVFFTRETKENDNRGSCYRNAHFISTERK